MAAPGTFTVRLTAGGATSQHPLVLRVDPRVERDGVTQAQLEEQLAFNLRARDLVSEVNRVADELRSARLRLAPGAAVPPAIAQLEQSVLTPPIRYSRPGIQAHIGYLYSMSLGADQQVGRDAIERYAELRKQLDDVKARLAQVVSSTR
jgi:hypothetical protein